MPSVTFKGMPASLHRALKERAARHKRSLNQEVLAILEQAVRPARKIDVERIIAEDRRFRESFGFTTTTEEIDRFKRQGRL